MIKIRKANGECTELEDTANFVEICTLDGTPAIVFYTLGNEIKQIDADTAASEMYEKRFDVKFAKVIDLEDRYEDVGEKE